MKRVCGFLIYISALCFFTVSFTFAAENSPLMPDLLGDDDFTEDWDKDFTEQARFADPLEPMNRAFFTFNDKMYDWVLKPVSEGYSLVFPYQVRIGFANVIANIGAPVRLANSILQGDADKSQVIVQRFLLNSTAGIFGLVDVARLDFGLQPQKADLGQTFGKWGIGFGPYIHVPFLGPSSLRDLVGTGGDIAISPTGYIYEDWAARGAFYSVKTVNKVSLHSDRYDDLRKMTLDPYVATRQAYYDYRSQLIKGKDQKD